MTNGIFVYKEEKTSRNLRERNNFDKLGEVVILHSICTSKVKDVLVCNGFRCLCVELGVGFF